MARNPVLRGRLSSDPPVSSRPAARQPRVLGHDITESRLAGNLSALDPGEYTTRSTTFNTLGSVTTACGAPADGRRAIIKCASDAVADGRFGENGSPWVDSADIGELERTVHFGQKVRAIGFGVSDANDQAATAGGTSR